MYQRSCAAASPPTRDAMSPLSPRINVARRAARELIAIAEQRAARRQSSI
jgi:hypothetical protein